MISVNKVDDLGPGRLSVGSCSERLEALEEQSEAVNPSPGWSALAAVLPHNRPPIFILPQTRELRMSEMIRFGPF